MNFTIRVEDIVILDSFKQTPPKEYKLEEVREYVRANGKLDRPVILKGDTLVDGYTRYLIAVEFGMEEIPCSQYSKTPHTFVKAKFGGVNKEYVWRIPKNGTSVEVGDKVLVRTKYGKKKTAIVTVIEVFTSDDIELMKHKKIIKKI